MRIGLDITATDVKAEAERRIEAIMPRWMIDRQVSGGAPLPDEVKARAEAIRAASNRLERLPRIPTDYRDERHWQ